MNFSRIKSNTIAHRYAITVAYDGTDYCGWQVQDHRISVAQTLEHAFAKTFGISISLLAASRTDVGVHAYDQLAIFDLVQPIDPKKLLEGWNNVLPSTIVIRSLVPVSPTFYPRHHVAYKIYHYHFFIERPLPFVARYGLYLEHAIDLKKLEIALQCFVGTHDFRHFCSNKDDKTTIKKIDMIALQEIKRHHLFRIVIRGESFLHHMIRRIVGAAIHIASYNNVTPDLIPKLLKGESNRSLPVAPAHGLMLRKVRYKIEKNGSPFVVSFFREDQEKSIEPYGLSEES